MDKLMYRPAEVAQMLGMGRTATFALIKSGRLRSIKLVVAGLPVLYSTTNVSASFHLAEASIQSDAGDQLSSLRRSSRVMRQTASSLLQRGPQMSAVASRWRSGERTGSVGRS